jgi:hypothetical protein
MSGKAFIDHFSALDDPRQAWKVVHPLPEILLVVPCATLGGAEDFVEIARWGQRKLYHPVGHVRPSSQTGLHGVSGG